MNHPSTLRVGRMVFKKDEYYTGYTGMVYLWGAGKSKSSRNGMTYIELFVQGDGTCSAVCGVYRGDQVGWIRVHAPGRYTAEEAVHTAVEAAKCKLREAMRMAIRGATALDVVSDKLRGKSPKGKK